MSSAASRESPQRWFDHLNELQELQVVNTQSASSDIHVVSSLRKAADAVACDDDWKDSGVREMLLKALQIAEDGNCEGAVSSARGILGFIQGRQSALKRIAAAKSQSNLPWDVDGSEAPSQSEPSGQDALKTGREVLQSTGAEPIASTSAAGYSSGSSGGSSRSSGGRFASSSDGGGGGGSSESDDTRRSSLASAPPDLDTDVPGRRPLRKSVSNPEGGRPPKRSRDDDSAPDMSRARSDPGAVRKAAKASPLSATPLDTVLEAVAARPPTPNRQVTAAAAAGGSDHPRAPADAVGSVASDETFPGHHSVADFFGPSPEIRQARLGTSNVDSASSLYWAGKVKHKLGSSTMELTFLSALLPREVIEHMPPTLFVTDLVERKGLTLGEGQTVVRCRLDFVTNRQLHKLRTLAGLKLACVCGLQHSSLTLVPHLDAAGGLRIISFVKMESN